MIDTTKGVTTAKGFLAAGVAAGLKKTGNKDIALVVNDGPEHVAAGVFTTNRFPAAPVQWSREVIEDNTLTAVILNSGGANACTGRQGLDDARLMARTTAEALGCEPRDVAVCSTGLIGELLPMDRVVAGIESAARDLSASGGDDAAEAIMTTDTVPKQAGWTSENRWSVAGMAKGAGMLAPGLATMLVVITTDADLTGDEAASALTRACHVSFDRADSDGCMSTNDSVILMANGREGRPDPEEFLDALTAVCLSLAQQLIADAEGAGHSIAITVTSAATEDDALEVARAVARSNLFKCAVAGNDPNWGRVLAAMGTTKAQFDSDEVDVSFNGVPVFFAGAPGAARDQVDLAGFDVEVRINLHAGEHKATIWTNDLTHGYVSENADYSS